MNNTFILNRIYRVSIHSVYWSNEDNCLMGRIECLDCRKEFESSMEKTFVKCPNCETILKVHGHDLKTSIC